MGFFFNGQTFAKKMLYNKGKYSKAYVGGNLVHTGTALTRYITWKVSDSYIILIPDGYINSGISVEFEVKYLFDFVSSNGMAHVNRQNTEHKYYRLSQGYNYQEIISLSPQTQPIPPSGFTLSSYTVQSVSPYYLYPTSDELYTYSFKAMS